MKPLVECVHPDLPDRVVLMPGGPRNGWQPRHTPKAPKKATKKTTRRQSAGGEDSPTAGQSTTITKDEE